MLTFASRPCVGNVAPVPRLNFGGLCLQDGPLAIRLAVRTSMPPATTLMFTSGLCQRLPRRADGGSLMGQGSYVSKRC